MAARWRSSAGEEERFHGLPPLKRFKMLEKEREQQNIDESKERRVTSQKGKSGDREGVEILCCLPAKKRVCALQFFTHEDEEEEEELENKSPPTLMERPSPVLPTRPLQPIELNCEPISENISAKEARLQTTKKGSMDSSSVTYGDTEVKVPKEQIHMWCLPAMAEKAPTGVKHTMGRKEQISAVRNALLPPRNKCTLLDANIIPAEKMDGKRKVTTAASLNLVSYACTNSPKMLITTHEDFAPINLHVSSTNCNFSTLVAKQGPNNTLRPQNQQQKETCTRNTSKIQLIHDPLISGTVTKLVTVAITGEGKSKCAYLRENEESNRDDESKCAYLKEKEESDGEDDGVFCDVCKEADADPSDPIVFCDGCNVMVHASCYGSPLIDGIPDGDWFCRQCESENRRKKADEGRKGGHVGFNVGQCASVSRVCCLCPSRKGAMKQTTSGAWAHLSCALYVPEVFYKQAREREKIECGSVPAWRWELPCVVCSTRGQGSCIQCTEVGCSSTFHVSCALDAGLSIDYRNANALTKTPAIVIAFCPSHSHQALLSSERRRFKIVPRA